MEWALRLLGLAPGGPAPWQGDPAFAVQVADTPQDRSIGGAPPSDLWATDPAGFGQVGCIYTAQGFEYDWSGVIMGPDLVWRDDGLIARRDASRDPALRSLSKVSDHEFGRLIRNVYKVLLTRGMMGTVIYSTDPETHSLLRSLI